MSLQVHGTFTANGSSLPYLALSDAPELGSHVNISIAGLTSTGATVTVQRSFDNGNTWKNIQDYTADAEAYATEPSVGVEYRLSCTGFTSGTIVYLLGVLIHGRL